MIRHPCYWCCACSNAANSKTAEYIVRAFGGEKYSQVRACVLFFLYAGHL